MMNQNGSSRKTKGNSYWTKYRKVRQSTESHMKEVRAYLRAEKLPGRNVHEQEAKKLLCSAFIQDVGTNLPAEEQKTDNVGGDNSLADVDVCVNLPVKKQKTANSEVVNNPAACNFMSEFSDDEFEDNLCDNEKIVCDSSSCSSMSDQEFFDEENTCNDQSSFTPDKLVEWAVKHNITQVALKDLLGLLKPLIPDLPKDPRTLLSTPRKYVIKKIGDGAYHHFGIRNWLLSLFENGFQPATSEIYLQINIDGVPLFKSTKEQFWPILGKISKTAFCPFIIGLFCGKSKPDNLCSYLSDFIEEMKSIQNYGIDVASGTNIKVYISCFVCDAPARAFLKQIKNHNAYYGCERCTVKGIWNGKVTFQDTTAPLRTDQDFNGRTDMNHHSLTPSPLSQLDVGMVSQFVLDPMHLVYLGVMKRLLLLWIKGPMQNNCRLGPTVIKSISNMLVIFQAYIPWEFGRKCRSLYDVERWKATEFRQFLLYSSIVVLRKHLSKEAYEHFLLFYVAVYSLSSPILYQTYSTYASKLLHGFVVQFGLYFGNDMLVYNVHNLIHLADDVQAYGPLDEFSAFSFESFLGKLKTLLRKPNHSLSQIIRRLTERKNVLQPWTTSESDILCVPRHKHNNGPLPTSHSSYTQYKCVNYKKHRFSMEIPDNCVKISGKVSLINNIISNGKKVLVIFEVYKKVESFFTYPLNSTSLGIFEISHPSGYLNMCDVQDIQEKYVRFPYKDNFVVISMLDKL